MAKLPFADPSYTSFFLKIVAQVLGNTPVLAKSNHVIHVAPDSPGAGKFSLAGTFARLRFKRRTACSTRNSPKNEIDLPFEHGAFV